MNVMRNYCVGFTTQSLYWWKGEVNYLMIGASWTCVNHPRLGKTHICHWEVSWRAVWRAVYLDILDFCGVFNGESYFWRVTNYFCMYWIAVYLRTFSYGGWAINYNWSVDAALEGWLYVHLIASRGYVWMILLNSANANNFSILEQLYRTLLYSIWLLTFGT